MSLSPFLVLAQGAANKNPWLIGGLFIAIGGLLLFFGIREWKSGVAKGKYGQEYTGGTAKLIAGIRIVAGIGISGFGLMKIFEALS